MMVPTEQTLELRICQPWTLHSEITLSSFLISLLVHNLVNILVIIKKHWLLFQHLGYRDMPVCSPPMLIKLGKIVRVSICRLCFGCDFIKLTFICMQMCLKLLNKAIIVPLINQINKQLHHNDICILPALLNDLP